MRVRGALAALCLLGASCAPTYAPGYQDAFAAGLRAQNAGRWEEAAAQFDKAAKLGERYKDRDEARLARAEALERLERWDEAEALYRKTEREAGGRYQGVRAAFALGRLVWERRGFEEGSKELLKAVRKYPSSGLVRHAIMRMLEHVEERDGHQAALAWLTPIQKQLASTEANEAVTYEVGTLLARCDRKEESIKTLLSNARRYPYPHGSLTDDGYYVASLFLDDVGRSREAIDVLEEMLRPQEEAHLGHSYRRPRFPAGALRIAVLYRDRFNDHAKARKAFWRVYDEYFDSRQTDDALFSLARMEKADGREEESCRVLNLLKKKKPDSRYLKCLSYVCPSIPKTDRPCSRKILEDLGVDPDEPWEDKPVVIP